MKNLINRYQLLVFLVQLAGFVAVSFIEDHWVIVGVGYGIILTAYGSYKSRGTKDLKKSPLLSFLLLSSFYLYYLAVFTLPFPDDFAKFLLRLKIPNQFGSIMFPLLPTLTVGMLWLNIWTKKHSKFVYIVCTISTILFGLFLNLFLALQHIGF